MARKRIDDKLMRKYEKELRKVLKDKRTIEYCLKNVTEIVELSNGLLYVIDKPVLKKSFCFNPTFGDECTQDMGEHFKQANLEPFNRVIDNLELCPFKTITAYAYRKGSKLAEIDFKSGYNQVLNTEFVLELSDIKSIRNAYLKVRANLARRVDTYLKKYGTAKLKIYAD